ncbi:PilZ domain-containing protein [Salinarimonas soli]|uniref:PilZ domain-containing protein n=1 Tax=Salinarimonas soli TaxID=1638099 RepID=A0A5B2VC92_9HYPH|nr:PilZ domain-containing protein [Salinarimonas soli]KAA2237073.1 PilZ domain-containing protein [Salinarimonas soli]
MQDSRSAPRQRAFLQGRIIFNGGNATLDCTIRDWSAGGARLELTNTVTIPDRFDLLVPQKAATYQATIAWRRENAVGVSFLDDRAQGPALKHRSSLDERVRDLEAEVADLRRILARMEARFGRGDPAPGIG